MKRFALFYNLIPEGRMRKIPWLVDNFDWIPFRRDVADLNEYELIYVYATSGGGIVRDWKPVTESNAFPKYLRDNGVTKPKIIYQRDNWFSGRDNFGNTEMLNYVDAILTTSRRGWNISKPVFTMCFPIVSDFKRWVPLEDKLDRAITVVRHQAPYLPSQEIADDLGIPLDVLGVNLERRYGEEYIDLLSKYKIGLSHHERYFGWSRFGAECAYAGTPVLAQHSVDSTLFISPELWGTTEHAKEMGRKLLDDKDFYDECRIRALKNVEYVASPERCEALLKRTMVCCGIVV